MELLLHYVWKHKIFPLQELKTTAGLSVEIIDPGLSNTNQGPDFFNAKIKVDGKLWAGNVEIHTISSDWNKHGHQSDKAYDSVILHVASVVDCEVFSSNGVSIPQMQLSCPEHVRTRFEALKLTDMKPPCFAVVPKLPMLTVHSWLSALQMERFEQKTNAIRQRLKQFDNHWEDVFFISLARNFGFGVNSDAFEAWAKLIPFRAVDKHRDNLEQVEAFFFGQAGMLEKRGDDPYYQRLQKEFRYLEHKFALPVADASRQKCLRMRPRNFPHVRIAQLAYLYHSERSLFSKAMGVTTLKELNEALHTTTSPYWEEHFNFMKASPQKEKKLGKDALSLIAINTVIPFLYAYGLHKGNEKLCARATAWLEELKAEGNYITKLWDGVGIPVNSAADSQALIQLQKEYCEKKKCLCCRFGFEYLRGK